MHSVLQPPITQQHPYGLRLDLNLLVVQVSAQFLGDPVGLSLTDFVLGRCYS